MPHPADGPTTLAAAMDITTHENDRAHISPCYGPNKPPKKYESRKPIEGARIAASRVRERTPGQN